MKFIAYAQRKLKAKIVGLVALAIVTGVACSEADTQPDVGLREIDHSYALYARVLENHVKGTRVDYAALKTDEAALDSCVTMVATADLKKVDERKRLAFYINAYNILTLRSIVAAYPVASIKKVDDVWTKKWKVAGDEISIDDLEHRVLRQQFNEPRIHMAINCASISCPPLMPWPYVADSLNQQLEIASAVFATSEQYNQLDPADARAELSQVFEWFGRDFVEQYFDPHKFPDLSNDKNAVLMFVISHHPKPEQDSLLVDSYEVKFRSYDWNLNDVER